MVFDHLSHAAVYQHLTRQMHHAFNFLRRPDLDQLSVGRYPIVGDDVYALVQEYTTKKPEDGKWEAHRRYLDVQFIASGVERMGYAFIDSMQVLKDYDEAGDYLLFTGEGTDLIMTPGTFAIFAPQDVHRPLIFVAEPVAVRKIVVKVRVD